MRNIATSILRMGVLRGSLHWALALFLTTASAAMDVKSTGDSTVTEPASDPDASSSREMSPAVRNVSPRSTVKAMRAQDAARRPHPRETQGGTSVRHAERLAQSTSGTAHGRDNKGDLRAKAIIPAKPPETAKLVNTATSESNTDPVAIAKAFCSVNAPAADEVRIAGRIEQLQALEALVAKKSEELSARTQDMLRAVKRREEILSRADDNLVAIYLKMKPEAAAQQLTAMNDETAMAIVSRFNARSASAVFNEMPSDKAARLAMSLSGRTTKDKSGKVER